MRPGGALPGVHRDGVGDGVGVWARAEGEVPPAVEVQLESTNTPTIATSLRTGCAIRDGGIPLPPIPV